MKRGLRIVAGLVLCAVLACGAWAAPGAARGGLIEDLRYQMAVKAAQERRWDKARALFAALRKAYPQDSRAAVQLAQVELEMGHADKAQAIAEELLKKDPADRFGLEILGRARRKPVVPEPPITFGAAPAASGGWERGDEFHIGVPVMTKAGVLSIGEPRLVEGPPPTPLETPPTVRYKLRFEVPGGPAGETELDPAPGPTALVEHPGKDGKLSGELVSLPPGQEMPKEAHLAAYLAATRLVMLDPGGVQRAERAVTVDEMCRGLMGIARPAQVPGLMAPIGVKMTGPQRLVPLARLSARLKPEYAANGQASGMWLRLRLVAELFVYPGLRSVPDAEVPRACPYLLWPLDPPVDGEEAVDALAQKLAAFLDRPNKNTRLSAAAAFRPFAERLDRDLKPALERYRTASAKAVTAPLASPTESLSLTATAPPASPTTSLSLTASMPSPAQPSAAPVVAAPTHVAAARELRTLVNLVLISGRITRLTQESDPTDAEAKARAAEALLFLSRFKISRK